MSAPPINFYADFQGLASLKNDAKMQDPSALKEAAKQFESLFTKMLLKSMREANESFGDSLFSSDQTDFYQDMFDDQIAVHMSKGKGLGLADMLIKQLAVVSGASPSGPLPDPPPPSGGGEIRSSPLIPVLSREKEEISNSPLVPALLRGKEEIGSSHPIPPRPGGVGQGGGVHAPLTTSKTDFVRSMWPHAEKAAREIGVDPHALLAQVALETGWGRSVPSDASGASSFNLFGIKAGSQWSGATVNVPTLEFEGGIPVRKVERFRSYESAADSFRDYAGLIRNSARYENALGAGGDVAAFASALQQGGYATDPNYARKIVAVAQELRGLTGGHTDDHSLKVALAAPIQTNAGPG